MIGLALALAWAEDCPEPGRFLGSAENDAMNYYIADAKAGLAKAIDAWGCGPRAAPADIARYLQIRGLIAFLERDEATATKAFASAKAAGLPFVTDYGPQARAVWEATPAPSTEPTALELKGRAEGEWLAVDGVDVSEVTVGRGLHLLQVGRGDAARVARMIDADGPSLIVSLPAPDVPAPDVPAPDVPAPDVPTADVGAPTPAPPSSEGGPRGPFVRLPHGRYADATGVELDWRPDLVDLARQDPVGRFAARRHRSNPVAQGVALTLIPAAGYGAYLFGWDATVGHNLPSGASWGATAGFATLGVTAAVWESALLLRRPKRRAEVEEAAARVSDR